ncbi:uncharacterized protein N7515_005419 [Penicillium bovifimosum]|uniref:Uncharacterized protein n=1 Tax=Penicillium bovifimosum TaxID=126998 RepID=A0A9W9L045_9EURO|nr:uncharacterized protein N7515_005419 [Penicillium bovifimosum]KAJ5129380.1 hypothetical protein N7515_005419 [Penicillium bovifimosum]
MTSKKERPAARQVLSVSRGHQNAPRVMSDSRSLLDDPWDEGSFQSAKSTDATHYALQTLNKHIERRLAKVQANTIRLKRELWLLQRHIKEFRHPLFENWEADVLTRLIEVAHAQQYQKAPSGLVIGQPTFAEREKLTQTYISAAKGIRLATLRKLGLSEKYHQALQRYSEVAPYRSSRPYQTEFTFAKWLIEEKENRPELYEFWSKLFPVCYNRSIDKSAAIF